LIIPALIFTKMISPQNRPVERVLDVSISSLPT
jgi:hypothetical protein